MDEVITKLIDMPTKIHGYTAKDKNGDFNIFINARINHETRVETYKHELKHINSDNFQSRESADLIEVYTHE